MKTPNRPTASLQIETLESREMPSATMSLSNGTLQIVANDANDSIRVYQNQGVIGVIGSSIGYRESAVRQIVVNGNGGNDRIDLGGVRVSATVYGGSGHDVLIGGQNADYLDGGSGEDRLFGMGGNDLLQGGNQDDRLFGGDGYDSMVGGYGTDYMWDGTTSRHEYYRNDNDGAPDYIADVLSVGGFSAAHVKQGSSAYTCAFLAAIGSMANAGINISNYIAFRGHDAAGVGQYDVKLFNGTRWQTIRVQFEGHTNRSDAQSTADFASWATIMHRAWLQLNGNRGTLPHVAITALGYRSSWTNTMNDQTFNAMATATAQRKIIACGTGRYSGLQTNHAYTVIQAGWVNGVRMVQIRNPWGYDGSGADSNPRDGYLWLTWSQFAGNINYVAIG